MKIKQEIEWVVGENPKSSTMKIIAVDDHGQVFTASGRYDSEFEHSEPRWCWENCRPIPASIKVLAWASMPTFEGFPAEGQKVEFTDAYRCDNPLCDPARTRRLVKAVEFIAKRLSLQVGREFADADVCERQELNQTIMRLDTIRDYILNGKDLEA